MCKNMNLFQYTCPSCNYTLYSESDGEELYCQTKSCNFKEPLHIKNHLDLSINTDSRVYTVEEPFMIDHGCHEVRPIKKGTEVELIKIRKGWYLVETNDEFTFFAPKEKFKRKV